MPPSHAHGASADGSRRSPHLRHRPETGLLYQTVERYYPALLEHLAARGRSLPRYVRREFEQYLKCGRLEYGFMRVRCELCHHEKLVAFSCKRRGFCPSCGARRMADSAALLIDQVLPPLPLRQWVLTLPIPLRLLCATDARALSEILRIVYRCLSSHLLSTAHLDKHRARTGAVTFIQRFGGSVNLNINIHFHILALDGVYRLDPTAKTLLHFRPVHPPTPFELQALIERVAQRIGRRLERLGYLTRESAEGQDPHLSFPDDAEPPEDQATLLTLQQAAITYRIALGPHAGQKAFTLKTLPPSFEDKGPELASAHGFSLHAGVACSPGEPDLLQRLTRYIARPALAESRLSLTAQGDLRYRIKSPWRDGTTHLILHPLDFLARLASLVPKPRVNLTRYHGILAPHARERSLITPAGRRAAHKDAEQRPRSPAHRRQAMTWAERLRRVFNIDVSHCERCGGTARIIACIENPDLIRRILTHLAARDCPARGPPQPDLLSA